MAMGSISERYRLDAIELRGKFPAVYKPLAGEEWRRLQRLMESQRPAHVATTTVKNARDCSQGSSYVSRRDGQSPTVVTVSGRHKLETRQHVGSGGPGSYSRVDGLGAPEQRTGAGERLLVRKTWSSVTRISNRPDARRSRLPFFRPDQPICWTLSPSDRRGFDPATAAHSHQAAGVPCRSSMSCPDSSMKGTA